MDGLEATRASINAQLAEIREELAGLISQGRANSGRAGSLRAQLAKLHRALRELEAAIRQDDADELERRISDG